MTLIAEKWKEVLCEKWGVQINLCYVYISGSIFKNSLSETYSPDCFFLKVPDKSILSFTSKCCVLSHATFLLTAWAPDMAALQMHNEEIQAIDWTGQVPNNLTLSQISIFTFHASFLPYHSLNIFTLTLPLSPLPLWLLLPCFIHLLSWCFFQSSFKIHFSFLSFPTELLNSHNSDLVSLTRQDLMWWKPNIGVTSLLYPSLSEPMASPSMLQCEGKWLLTLL